MLTDNEQLFLLNMWAGRPVYQGLSESDCAQAFRWLAKKSLVMLCKKPKTVEFTERGWIAAKELADEFPSKHYARCSRCGGLINYQEWVVDPERLLFCSEECRDGIMDDWGYL